MSISEHKYVCTPTKSTCKSESRRASPHYYDVTVFMDNCRESA